MLLPRKTTWAIIGACFLAFLSVSEAKADFTAISQYPTTNSYKQIGYTGNGSSGLTWTATSTGQVNAATFFLCDDSTATYNYYVYAKAGTRSGSTITWTSTSTNTFNELDLEQQSDVTGCYGSLLAYTFNFDDFTVTSGNDIVIKPVMSESHLNEGFLMIRSSLDTDFDVLEGTTVQDSLTPRFRVEYDPYAYDPDVEVIENPDYDPDLIVEVESEEAIDISKYKECIIGEDCFWKFGYNSSYDDGTFYLIYDQEPRSRDSALDTVALGTKIIRSDRFEVPAATSTGIVDYCVFLENVDADLELICGLQVKWYDEYESAALAMQECISTACDDVSTSTAWWDIDFQGAIECGFRKTTCWLTTPSGAAKIRYREIVGQSGQPGEIEQNFPLSVIAQFRSLFTAASIATTSTSTQYFAPIRVYDPSTGGMRTLAYMFNNKMLENGMGQYYDFYYSWATKILWLLFALYMFNRIYQVINPSSGSLFDLVLPGKRNHEAMENEVGHIDVVDLRRQYPKSNLTIDLRKKRF